MKNRTISKFALLAVATALSFAVLNSSAQEKKRSSVIHGPAQASFESIGQINIPTGFNFVNGKDTRALLEASGEPVGGDEMGLIIPTNHDWSVLFRYENIGYVKDDEKDKLNPDKILASIKKGTDAANKERVKNGTAPIELVGWEIPPKYDETTHNLEWAIRGTCEGKPLLNYNTRLLGRKGVMEVVLVVDPDSLSSTLPEFRQLLSTYSFQNGQTYAEFRSGDKVAKYGLAALVVGGAAAGAAKLGLLSGLFLILKKAWKLVIIGVAAVATAIKKFFARIFGGKSQNQPANQ